MSRLPAILVTDQFDNTFNIFLSYTIKDKDNIAISLLDIFQPDIYNQYLYFAVSRRYYRLAYQLSSDYIVMIWINLKLSFCIMKFWVFLSILLYLNEIIEKKKVSIENY